MVFEGNGKCFFVPELAPSNCQVTQTGPHFKNTYDFLQLQVVVDKLCAVDDRDPGLSRIQTKGLSLEVGVSGRHVTARFFPTAFNFLAITIKESLSGAHVTDGNPFFRVTLDERAGTDLHDDVGRGDLEAIELIGMGCGIFLTVIPQIMLLLSVVAKLHVGFEGRAIGEINVQASDIRLAIEWFIRKAPIRERWPKFPSKDFAEG